MTKINFEQLSTFLSVVRLGGIRRASDSLNVTQPAVTARIKNLEHTISAKLFERTSGGLKLTKRGELLVTYAERFEHLNDLIGKYVIYPSGIEGRLRLGVSETIAQCWLPELISELHQQFPKLEVDINVDISVNLRSGLLNRELDLAILLGPISEYSVDNIKLPGFDLAWYIAVDMDVSDTSAPPYATKPVITYARNTRPHRELKTALFDRVGTDVTLFPSSSLSAAFRLVEAGLGVAALPKILGNAFVNSGTLKEFHPGWIPSPLLFTASYLGEPKSHLTETAAKIAQSVANQYLSINNIDH